MKPAPFVYRRPTTLDEAVALLRAEGDAKLIAGGQSLVPLMNFRLARPSLLVDLNAVPGLAYVREEDGALAIGAMTRQADIEASPLARARQPLLVAAVRNVGHAAIRNRGTVGGSIAHADPAAELPCILLTTDGSVRTYSPAGGRLIAARDFFVDLFQNALAPDEILVEVRYPIPPPGSGWAFEEVARRHGDFALAMVAVLLVLDASGRVTSAAVGLGGVASTPVRARSTEALLVGAWPDPPLLDAAAAAIAADIDPGDDLHATAEDRRHLAVALGRRALDRAFARARKKPEVD